MKTKELYKIINEEIGDFDFLGNNTMQEEQSHEKVVNSKDFQTKLVHDLMTKGSENILKLSATYVNKNSNVTFANENPSLLELELDIKYQYDGRNYDMILFLDGEESVDGVDYESFNLKLFSKGAEEINISWLEKNAELTSKLVKILIAPYL